MIGESKEHRVLLEKADEVLLAQRGHMMFEYHLCQRDTSVTYEVKIVQQRTFKHRVFEKPFLTVCFIGFQKD